MKFRLRGLIVAIATVALLLAIFRHWGALVAVGFGLVVFAVAVMERSQNRIQTAAAIVFFYMIVVGFALTMHVETPRARPRRRVDCSSKLRQVALALHMYHQVHGQLPPAHTVDAQGNRLHSWRTLILPYLEATSVYDQLRLDEPWDSEHNCQFHHITIPYYICPFRGRGKSLSETDYVAVVGYNTAWPGRQSVKFDDVTDSHGETLLLAEMAASGIHWMEPRDMPMSQALLPINAPGGLGMSSRHPGGSVWAAFVGSNVASIPDDTDPARIRAWLSIAGGEPTDAE